MIQVRRIGHATFETPDLDKAVDYYAAVNGLTLIGRGDATAYLASGTGLLTIALQRANAARCARLTFEVAPDSDLAAVVGHHRRALQAAALKAWGGKAETVAAGQRAFTHRAKMNGVATLGKWDEKQEKAA